MASFLGELPAAELDMLNFTGFDFSGVEASLPAGTHFKYTIDELIPGREGLYLTVAPEPGTLMLLVGGGIGLLAVI